MNVQLTSFQSETMISALLLARKEWEASLKPGNPVYEQAVSEVAAIDEALVVLRAALICSAVPVRSQVA